MWPPRRRGCAWRGWSPARSPTWRPPPSRAWVGRCDLGTGVGRPRAPGTQPHAAPARSLRRAAPPACAPPARAPACPLSRAGAGGPGSGVCHGGGRGRGARLLAASAPPPSRRAPAPRQSRQSQRLRRARRAQPPRGGARRRAPARPRAAPRRPGPLPPPAGRAPRTHRARAARRGAAAAPAGGGGGARVRGPPVARGPRPQAPRCPPRLQNLGYPFRTVNPTHPCRPTPPHGSVRRPRLPRPAGSAPRRRAAPAAAPMPTTSRPPSPRWVAAPARRADAAGGQIPPFRRLGAGAPSPAPPRYAPFAVANGSPSSRRPRRARPAARRRARARGPSLGPRELSRPPPRGGRRGARPQRAAAAGAAAPVPQEPKVRGPPRASEELPLRPSAAPRRARARPHALCPARPRPPCRSAPRAGDAAARSTPAGVKWGAADILAHVDWPG